MNSRNQDDINRSMSNRALRLAFRRTTFEGNHIWLVRSIAPHLSTCHYGVVPGRQLRFERTNDAGIFSCANGDEGLEDVTHAVSSITSGIDTGSSFKANQDIDATLANFYASEVATPHR